MAAPPALPDLDIRIDGAVAEVRLARPQARNALSHALMGQLIEAAAFFRASTETQAVILTGAESYFSAGADLADPDRGEPRTRLEQRHRGDRGLLHRRRGCAGGVARLPHRRGGRLPAPARDRARHEHELGRPAPSRRAGGTSAGQAVRDLLRALPRRRGA